MCPQVTCEGGGTCQVSPDATTHPPTHPPMELSPVKPYPLSTTSTRAMKSSTPRAPWKCCSTLRCLHSVQGGRGSQEQCGTLEQWKCFNTLRRPSERGGVKNRVEVLQCVRVGAGRGARLSIGREGTREDAMWEPAARPAVAHLACRSFWFTGACPTCPLLLLLAVD